MLNPNELTLMKELWMYMKDLLLGFVGGMFSYVVPYYKDYKNGKVFLLGMFLTRAFLGAIVAWLVGGSLGIEVPFRDALIFASGFVAFTIAVALDKEFIIDILEIWVGRLKK